MIANFLIDHLWSAVKRDVHEVPGLIQVRLDWQVIVQTLLDVIRPRSGGDKVAAPFIFLEDRIDLFLSVGTELIKSDGSNRLVPATVPTFGGGHQMPNAECSEKCNDTG